MENSQFAIGFLNLAYRDYLASRFLLNNGFTIQGVTLASSSIEKYLKVILAVHGIKKKVHLDNLDELKSEFKKIGYQVLFEKFDQVFFDILGKAYKYRYYDESTVKKPDTIGFIIHQFIGELDYTVALINKLVTINDNSGDIIPSKYQRDINDRNENLFLNNYILNNISKIEFMRRSGQAFGLHVNPDFLGTEIEIDGRDVPGNYDGNICTIIVSNGL